MQVSAPMRMYSTTALCSLPLHYSRALFYCTHMIIDCYTIIVMYRLQFGGAKVCKLHWPRRLWSVNRSVPAPSNPTWLFRWGGGCLCRQVALVPKSTIMCCAYICNYVLCLHLPMFFCACPAIICQVCHTTQLNCIGHYTMTQHCTPRVRYQVVPLPIVATDAFNTSLSPALECAVCSL